MTRPRVLRLAVCASWILVLSGLSPSLGQERIVNVIGWSGYIDPDVIRDFTKETGIEVTYDPYDVDDTLEAQLKTNKTTFDVAIVSGRTLQRQIAEGFYVKLNKTKLPNARYLSPAIMAHLAAYDPGNLYAVNYIWFTMGIAYDATKAKTMTGAEADTSLKVLAAPLSDRSVDSWNVVFKPENLRKFLNCGVGVVNSIEDLFATARRYLWSDWRLAPGLSPQTDLGRAADLLNGIRRDVRKLDSTKYVEALATGEVCLAVGYSLESFRARDQALEVKNGITINYTLPKEGAPISLDNLAIPKEAVHIQEAYEFIDFLLRPEIAARNTNFTRAANGIPASKILVDKKIADNKSIYPDDVMMQRLFVPQKREFAAQEAVARDWARTRIGRWRR
jgi:putrescine transport system substrate-binding protein